MFYLIGIIEGKTQSHRLLLHFKNPSNTIYGKVRLKIQQMEIQIVEKV